MMRKMMSPDQQQGQGNGTNAPVIPVQVEQAFNKRSITDGPLSQDQMSRIHDTYAGAAAAVEDNNGRQATLTAEYILAAYKENSRVPWWKRALQVLGVAGIFGVGFVTHKALSSPKTTETNSVPTE